MLKDEKLKSSEIVIRVLVRLPDELKGRPSQDSEDFLRKKKHRSSGLPEDGLSFLRKSILRTPGEIYRYVNSKKPMGFSECTLGELTDKHLKYIVTGKNDEHLSIRCTECNMSEDRSKGIVCKPDKAKGFEACPFFGIDPFDLNKLLKVVAKPTVSQITKKA